MQFVSKNACERLVAGIFNQAGMNRLFKSPVRGRAEVLLGQAAAQQRRPTKYLAVEKQRAEHPDYEPVLNFKKAKQEKNAAKD